MLNYIDQPSQEIFNKFEKIFISMIEHRSTQELENKSDPKYEYYQQEFIKRYYENFTAIKMLYSGKMIKHKKNEYNISLLTSSMTLIRSCMENYSLFYYIYKSPETIEESRIRFKCWWREGFLRRQSFLTEDSFLLDKKNKEKKMIDDLFEELKLSDFYLSLDSRQKKNFKEKGSWIFKGYRQLLIIAGFHKTTASNIYNYYSTYTHTTSPGLMQLAQASTETKIEMQNTFLKPLFMATGSYVFYYLNQLKSFKLKNEDWEFINAWKTIMDIKV